MCLALVNAVHTPALPEEQTAWKVGFKRHADFVTQFDNKRYPCGVWFHAEVSHSDCLAGKLTADNTYIRNHDREEYPLGFHCYKSKEQAQTCSAYVNGSVVAEVRIRSVVAEGIGVNKCAVVVAEEIMFVNMESIDASRTHAAE